MMELGILAVLLISLLAFTEPATILLDEEHDVPRDFSRSYFPEGFTFGVSTSAYQVEGEANKKGRGPSVWDIFARESSERIKDQSNGDVAVDFYNRYAEDIQLMKDIGLNAFRFSISWSRIIPSGRVRDGVNEEGIEFYNKLINETKSKGDNSYGEDGKLIGPQAYSPWFYIYPKGIRHLLNYTKDTYNNPVIYITENGVDEYNNETLSWQEGTLDDHRIQYYKTHLWNVLGSIKEYNVNVKGYFAWSFMDNYEWNIGYTSRFGLYYVDYKDNMKRHPKNSASWFASFLDSRREWILPISSNVTKISSRASKYI
ncbi:hypothetical protein GH714_016488 [Hevea brasiliensis]|uniref:Beta-glucosidase n=1 Tax=Hevea brasiliensis TaxID=3981 RepID=A0A6A6N086_HEVBR|nr:hypothetical protein GH714_016488 [Hevea brasiliensis]